MDRTSALGEALLKAATKSDAKKDRVALQLRNLRHHETPAAVERDQR